MVLGCTGGQRDQRAVSNVVGVVLLVGLAIAGAIIVVTLGGTALDSATSQTHSDVAEDSMQEAASGIKSIAGSSVDSSTAFEFPNRLNGQVDLVDTTTSSGVSISVETSDGTYSGSADLDTIVYEQDGSTLALQGGGVWKQTGDSVAMVSPPEFGYADGQISFSLVDFEGTEAISKGKIVAKQDIERTRTRTNALMDNFRDAWDDGSEATVTFKIETEYTDGWENYAKEEFVKSDLDGVDDVEVSTVDGGDAVKITFIGLDTSSISDGGTPSEVSSENDPGDSTSDGSPTDPVNDSPTVPDDEKTVDSGEPDSGTVNERSSSSQGEDEDTSRDSGTSDSDGDGIPDADDDCPEVPGYGFNGCPVLTSDDGTLTLNTDSAELSYLGTQVGVENETETQTDVRNPMDVAFVLDESGSMMWGQLDYEYKIYGPGTAEVPSDKAGRVVECGSWSCYYVDAVEPGGSYDLDSNQELRIKEPGNDPHGERVTATRSFLDALNDSLDRAAAVQFDSHAQTTYQLTSDLDTVKNLETDVGGGTNIAAGIWDGLDEIEDSSDDRNKVMVVLSDGQDNEGSSPIVAAADAAEEGVTIYTVGLGDSVDTEQLQGVASETGGSYYHASDAGELEEVFEEIASDTKYETARSIDHQPLTMDVSAGDVSGSLGESGMGPAMDLNHPDNVHPIDPGVRTYSLSGMSSSSDLSLSANLMECGSRTETGIDQSNGENTYVHMGCSGSGTAATYNDYTVYRDGDTLSQSSLEWWQQDAPALLDDADAEIDTDGEVDIEENQALVMVSDMQGGYSLLLVEAENADRDPVAVLSASDASPVPGEEVTLNASESHDPNPDDEIVAYRFGDGSWQDSPTTTHTFESAETVTVTVKNNDGETDTAQLDLEEGNQPAIAELSADTTVFEGEVTLDASGSEDPDSDEEIDSYEWDSDDASISGDETTTVTFEESGTKTVALTVESEDETTASTTLDIEVEDRDPVAKLTVPEKVSKGEDVTLDASDSYDPDAGDTISEYNWGSEWTDDATETISVDSDTEVSVRVRNSDGEEATVTTEIEVVDSPPQATLVADDEQIFEGNSVTFQVEDLEDPDDGDSPTVTGWEVDGTAEPGESGTSFTKTFSTSAGVTDQNREVTAVIESGGETIRPTVEINVQNKQPKAVLKAPTNIADDKDLTLDATDSSDSPVSDLEAIRFEVIEAPAGSSVSDTGWISVSGNLDTVGKQTFSSGETGEGTYKFEATVRDDDGATTSTQIMVTVGGSTDLTGSPLDLSQIFVELEDD